jgi:hypothetical protein
LEEADVSPGGGVVEVGGVVVIGVGDLLLLPATPSP